MARVLVTGWAGFIGSHLTERLLRDGHQVIGIDMRPGPQRMSEQGVRALKDAGLRAVRGDLLDLDLGLLLGGVDYVLHLAGQPGVRTCWGEAFRDYTWRNVDATQRLLEACATYGSVRRFVLASTSAVYGRAPRPFVEDGPLLPESPYGVTKMAAEHLVRIYGQLHGLSTGVLRYFTVYGPRQRPDMAFNRFITAIQRGSQLPIYGSLEQSRDYTYVGDAVDATVRAMLNDETGLVANVASGRPVTLAEVLSVLELLAGQPLPIRHERRGPGEMEHTLADVTRAREKLGYAPSTSLLEGLARQWRWQVEGRE